MDEEADPAVSTSTQRRKLGLNTDTAASHPATHDPPSTPAVEVIQETQFTKPDFAPLTPATADIPAPPQLPHRGPASASTLPHIPERPLSQQLWMSFYVHQYLNELSGAPEARTLLPTSLLAARGHAGSGD
jgi:hypothetical protein